MKVTRNTSHNLRHDWLSLSDERGKIEVSLLAMRSEIVVDVTIDGAREEIYWTPRKLAEALSAAIRSEQSQS